MKKSIIIENYEYACDNILQKINDQYFDGEADTDWVGGEIGGVALVADYFFDIEYMVTAIKHNATEKQFFDYYYLQIETHENKTSPKYNFKNYIKYFNGFNKPSQGNRL